jgi:hypothetical protein
MIELYVGSVVNRKWGYNISCLDTLKESQETPTLGTSRHGSLSHSVGLRALRIAIGV